MSGFWKDVFDGAISIATRTNRRSDAVLQCETPIKQEEKPPTNTENAVSLGEVVVSPQDRAVVVPVVMDNWSLLDRIDGELVAPQGVGLVPCILQMPRSAARPKVITGNVIGLNFNKMMAITQGKNGVTYHVHLGKPSKVYADFFQTTRLAHSYVGYEDIVTREALK